MVIKGVYIEISQKTRTSNLGSSSNLASWVPAESFACAKNQFLVAESKITDLCQQITIIYA